jgi:hypothetical protein
MTKANDYLYRRQFSSGGEIEKCSGGPDAREVISGCGADPTGRDADFTLREASRLFFCSTST